MLRERIARRLRDGRDASDADLDVLDLQLRVRDPVAADESPHLLSTDCDRATLQQRCAALAAELSASLPATTPTPDHPR